MQKLFATRRFPEKVMQKAAGFFDLTIRDEARAPLNKAECIAALNTHDAIMPTLGDPFDAGVFAAVPAPRCKILANFGVGYNHIDAMAARAAGVMVSNTPGTVTDATADTALALILMTCRRAGEGDRLVRSGQWKGWGPTELLGLHVTGKTLGIIGMGRIGKAVAKRCHHGFDMNVVFHNRSPVADAGVPATQLADLHQVMATADVVVVTVPGGAATYHLIDGSALSAMQPHAFFINVSRGDVVEEAALIRALQNKNIAGAGLDVYEQEPLVPATLTALDNTVLLPHLGTAALEVREAMGFMALDNAIACLSGKPLPNAV